MAEADPVPPSGAVTVARKKKTFLRDFARLDGWTRASAILVGLMMLLVVFNQFFYWDTKEDYSFGFLVPLFAIFVLSDRWRVMRTYLFASEPPKPISENTGFLQALDKAQPILTILVYAGTAACAVIFLLGGLVWSTQGPANLASLNMAVGLMGTTLGLAYINYTKDGSGMAPRTYNRLAFALLFLFPAAIWLISTPMLIDLTGLRLTMMGWVAKITEGTFNFFGEPVIRMGNVLILPNGGRVGVEDACSGVRSLTACIFAGSFLGAIFLNRFWKKSILIGMAVIFAFALNCARSIFLTIWANIHGPASIDQDFWGNAPEIENAAGKLVENPDFLLGTVHDVAGYGVLGITFVLLLSLVPLLNIQVTPPDNEVEPTEALQQAT